MKLSNALLLSPTLPIAVIATRTPAYLSTNATTLYQHALALMEQTPLVDTHVDMPQILRVIEKRPLDAISAVTTGLPGHVDIPKMRAGHLGGVFMSVWTPCPEQLGRDPGPGFLNPDDTLRDALEMYDIIREMVEESHDLEFAYTVEDITTNHKNGKISAFIGLEGSHMLGNSLSLLRVYAHLGIRYLTLTHTCHNAFASSAGAGSPLEEMISGNGLSALGKELVRELNRLGMMVDLSHVSDQTMRDAMDISEAPVIFSHSGARSMQDHPRNVPDDILKRIGLSPGQIDGVVFSVFYPPFISEDATVANVADHIEYIADLAGKAHVGIGSDFDGMYSSVKGLDDASAYPHLVMELLHRSWTDDEIRGVLSGNLMRVLDKVDQVKERLSPRVASRAIHDLRPDMPARGWGGAGDAYLPTGVKTYIESRRLRDEL